MAAVETGVERACVRVDDPLVMVLTVWQSVPLEGTLASSRSWNGIAYLLKVQKTRSILNREFMACYYARPESSQ